MPVVAWPEPLGKSSGKIPCNRPDHLVGASVQPTKSNRTQQMLKDSWGWTVNGTVAKEPKTRRTSIFMPICKS